ncbi:MAG TPA: hypothetical protein VIK71_06835 [Flavobacteriales bacterium]
MRFFLLLSVIVSSVMCGYGQSSADPYYVSMNWKVGDRKMISAKSSAIIYLDGNLLQNASSEASYELIVRSKNEDTFEIGITNTELGEPFNALLEQEQLALFNNMMQELIQRLNQIELRYLISSETGNVIEFINAEEASDSIYTVFTDLTESFLKLFNQELSQENIEKTNELLISALDEKMTELLESMSNTITLLFQVYDLPYIINQTYVIEKEHYEVDQVNYGNITYSGQLEIFSTRKGNTLTISYDTYYDEQELFNIFKDRIEQIEGYKESFEFKDKSSYQIDMATSWPKSYSNSIDIRIGGIRTLQNTFVEFKDLN